MAGFQTVAVDQQEAEAVNNVVMSLIGAAQITSDADWEYLIMSMFDLCDDDLVDTDHLQQEIAFTVATGEHLVFTAVAKFADQLKRSFVFLNRHLSESEAGLKFDAVQWFRQKFAVIINMQVKEALVVTSLCQWLSKVPDQEHDLTNDEEQDHASLLSRLPYMNDNRLFDQFVASLAITDIFGEGERDVLMQACTTFHNCHLDQRQEMLDIASRVV